jgi:hypothetical protein
VDTLAKRVYKKERRYDEKNFWGGQMTMIVEFLRKLALPGIETRIEVDKITLR